MFCHKKRTLLKLSQPEESGFQLCSNPTMLIRRKITSQKEIDKKKNIHKYLKSKNGCGSTLGQNIVTLNKSRDPIEF